MACQSLLSGKNKNIIITFPLMHERCLTKKKKKKKIDQLSKKTYIKINVAYAKDPDQSAHLHTLIRILTLNRYILQ